MSDWRDELSKIIRSRGEPGMDKRRRALEESRQEIANLMSEVVVPAFEELREELEAHDRECHLDAKRLQATLTVYKQGREEFSYAVRGHAYHKMSFAYPEIGRDDEPRMARVEIVEKQGSRRSFDPASFTKEGIIKDFLEGYARWSE